MRRDYRLVTRLYWRRRHEVSPWNNYARRMAGRHGRMPGERRMSEIEQMEWHNCVKPEVPDPTRPARWTCEACGSRWEWRRSPDHWKATRRTVRWVSAGYVGPWEEGA